MGFFFLKTRDSSRTHCRPLVECKMLRENSIVDNNDLLVKDNTIYGKLEKIHIENRKKIEKIEKGIVKP